MADENTKNQDSKLDENPGSTESIITDVVAEEEEDLLFEIDDILNTEDPDFLNQLTKIEIDNDAADLSVMGNVFGLDPKAQTGILNILKRPFELMLNTKQVLIFWTILFFTVLVGTLIWNFKSSFIQQNLFLNSFAELGEDLKEYNPNSEVEAFYDNLRFSKNLVTITPMNVNLKPSENSGPNPMLSIEVTTEGLAADAIIEVKDREAELKDFLLRLTEDKTYDELIEAEGKQLLCEQYRDLLNSLLTRGQVRRVLLKSFIIKP
ncbi:MAG: flagellar basal body-associated FliL family protein [Bdellovibrionota bacterium]